MIRTIVSEVQDLWQGFRCTRREFSIRVENVRDHIPLSDRAFDSLQIAAADRGTETLAELADDPHQLQFLRGMPGIGPAALQRIQDLWIRDHIRSSVESRFAVTPVQSRILWGVFTSIIVIGVVLPVSIALMPFVAVPGTVLVVAVVLAWLPYAESGILENEELGVPELFGRRIRWLGDRQIVFDEGRHPKINGVLDWEKVNTRERATIVAGCQGWSKDEDPIIIGTSSVGEGDGVTAAVLRWRVYDPYLWSSMTTEEIITNALPGRATEVLRSESRGYTSEQIRSGRRVEAKISSLVEEGINSQAWGWGIYVIDDGVYIPTVDVDPDIRKAIEKLRADERYRAAANAFVEEMIARSMAPAEALRRFQVHRGEVSEEIKEVLHRVGLDEASLGELPDLIRLAVTLWRGGNTATTA